MSSIKKLDWDLAKTILKREVYFELKDKCDRIEDTASIIKFLNQALYKPKQKELSQLKMNLMYIKPISHEHI